MSKNIWRDNPDCLIALKQCIAEQMSGSRTAERLNMMFPEMRPFTRGACLGKAWRMKWGFDGNKINNRRIKTVKPDRRRHVRPVAKIVDFKIKRRGIPMPPTMTEINTVTDIAIPMAQRRTIMTIEHKMCRWPIGDPRELGFFFCAAPTVDNYSYCQCHLSRSLHRAA